MLFFLCMDYVGGVNMSLRTANKIPQAYPLLVLEQEAKIRSCYNIFTSIQYIPSKRILL